MGDNPLEDLINKLRETIDRSILTREVNDKNRVTNDGYIVRYRVCILKPSYPSYNWSLNSTIDTKGIVTRINLW